MNSYFPFKYSCRTQNAIRLHIHTHSHKHIFASIWFLDLVNILHILEYVYTDELWYGSLLWRCTISTTSTHKCTNTQVCLRTTHIQIAWISSFYERIVILYWNGPISLFTTAKYSFEMHENQGYKFRATFHLINNNLEIFAIEWRWFAVGGHELGLCSQLYNELFVKFWNLKGTQKYRLQLCTWLCWI